MGADAQRYVWRRRLTSGAIIFGARFALSVLFSVILPVKNRTRLLARALESLRRQTFENFDVVIVDDGSDEDIVAIAHRFRDLRITLLPLAGRGAPGARNAGADAARGRYLAYLDSDDVFLPDKLARAHEAIAVSGADVLAGSGFVWRGNVRVQLRPSRGPACGEDISEFYFAADQRIQTSCLIVRADWARRVRWDEALRKYQDPDFLIRLVRAGGRLRFIEEPLTVLYDDARNGRISYGACEANLAAWLARSEGVLTARARIGFELYAMSYEAGQRSKLSGLWMIVKRARAGAVPAAVAAKAAYRLLAPYGVFKATAQLALLRHAGSRRPDLALYLAELNAAAAAATCAASC